MNSEVQHLLSLLSSENPSEREQASARIGDWLEWSVFEKDDLIATVSELCGFASREPEQKIRESLLFALVTAAQQVNFHYCNVDLLESLLMSDDGEAIAHVMEILAATRNPKYKGIIVKYLASPNAPIALAAKEALLWYGVR